MSESMENNNQVTKPSIFDGIENSIPKPLRNNPVYKRGEKTGDGLSNVIDFFIELIFGSKKKR